MMGILLRSGPAAWADTDYTYSFLASAGQSSDFNGSTVVLDVPSGDELPPSLNVLNYDLLASSPYAINGSCAFDDYVSGASSSGWSGYFCGTEGNGESWYMGSSGIGFYMEDDPTLPSEYAAGSWTLDAPAAAAPPAAVIDIARVPDASQTFALLGVSLATIATARRLCLPQITNNKF